MPTLLDKGSLKQPDLPDAIPIDYIVERVKMQIQEAPNQINPFANRLMILEAGTATGKSITVAPELYIMTQGLSGYSRKTVICTQPRILTAQEIPHELHDAPYFARHNFKFRLGENLGTQSSASVEKGDYGLLFATLGVLERQLAVFDPRKLIEKYSIIVIDEAHERQLIFDSTISQVKKFFLSNRDNARLPFLVLMSATFDVDKYARFFGVGQDNIVRVQGFSFPIEERWPKTSVPNVLAAAYDKIVECIGEEVKTNRDEIVGGGSVRGEPYVSDNRILVFVTGAYEGKQMKKKMQAWERGRVVDGIKVYVDTMYVDSAAVKKVSADYLKLTGSAEEPFIASMRTEVLVVNAVAETGLSLNNLRYVIDCGWSKESEFNPEENITTILVSKPAAQSRIRQRRGRVGRKKPGVFIPLYTKETFDMLEKIQIPEILKLDPTALVLSVIMMNGTFDERIGEFLMDVPPKSALKYALDKLQVTGFIDEKLQHTPFANVGSKIIGTVGVEGATMIMSALAYGASIDDLIVISTMMKYKSAVSQYSGFNEKRVKAMLAAGKSAELRTRERHPDEYEALFGTVIQGMPAKDGFYKLRAILADEFIESLIIFRAFEAAFDKIDPSLTPTKKYAALEKWCDKVFLVTDQMLEIYRDYIDVKSNLCMAGVNIVQNADKKFTTTFRYIDTFADVGDVAKWTSAAPAMMDPIVRLKLCIRAGYQFNSATYDEDAGGYRIDYGGLVVSGGHLFQNDPANGIDWSRFGVAEKYMPHKILFYKSEIMMSASQNRYVCTLHGIMEG